MVMPDDKTLLKQNLYYLQSAINTKKNHWKVALYNT